MFGDTPLPPMLVRSFRFGLVFVETAVGLLVLLGLWTQEALLVGSAAMAALIFGTALGSEWDTVAIQLLPPFTPRSSHASTTLIPLMPSCGAKVGFC
jgi:uncharacterized membrane protein YphA (DoxX/SURF4 family)